MIKMHYLIWHIILFFSMLIFLMFDLYFIYMDSVLMIDYELFTLNSMIISMTFLLDMISFSFISCVLFISSLVIMYSHMYMYDDENKVRFLYLVLLFVFSMFMLIISPNLISILIGWDGLGLISYCLVIYFQNSSSYNSGMLTIMINRIGDVMILLSIAWMMNYGSWHYFYYVFNYSFFSKYIIIMMIIASFTKSAQIPFSSWLPAAMAAPTPVSSLVHSSTLVTAGVYLLIRFSNLLYNMDCNFFLYISMMTMIMSGLVASFEYDLKKIIALSTLSQLGLMMVILFFGYPMLSFFHLLTHAFFKALLFLCAGLIIHVMSNTQDIRYMGGLYNQIPITLSSFLISNLSLTGFPFLSGFYSKDLIIEIMLFNGSNFFITIMMYFSLILTVAYTTRLFYYLIFINCNKITLNSYFENYYYNFPMILLSFMSVFSGSLMSWMIFLNPEFIFLTFQMKMLTLLMLFLGLFLGFLLSLFNYNGVLFGYKNNLVFNFMNSMWFLVYLNSSFMNKKFFLYSKKSSNLIEYSWGEKTMSMMSYNFMISLSKINQIMFNNNLSIYMISFFLLLVLVII
uniref:NADH-ubiquinone oxidoreductase chain 5 n=1 Tax=Hydrometra greeni TaxID=1492928 RepID=C5HIP4_9HEMI|nr:NADH dehydrogenase subunit 5 [Hydrometra greeni]ACJ69489.1 NADH dehydrogenase subunit 5 [Hydrometra greeni]